jgi:hypothetical protein
MSEADEDGTGGARARRLREEIARLRRPGGPGEDESSPGPMSPREFTDAAAGRAASEGNRPHGSVPEPETEAGDASGSTSQ